VLPFISILLCVYTLSAAFAAVTHDYGNASIVSIILSPSRTELRRVKACCIVQHMLVTTIEIAPERCPRFAHPVPYAMITTCSERCVVNESAHCINKRTASHWIERLGYATCSTMKYVPKGTTRPERLENFRSIGMRLGTSHPRTTSTRMPRRFKKFDFLCQRIASKHNIENLKNAAFQYAARQKR
jgi:hypothetical protein